MSIFKTKASNDKEHSGNGGGEKKDTKSNFDTKNQTWLLNWT